MRLPDGSPIRFVLFDAGNTLVHLDYAFIAEALAEHGYRVTTDAIRHAEYVAKAALDRVLAPEGVLPVSAESLVWQDGAGERPAYFTTMLDHLGIRRPTSDRLLLTLKRHHEATSLWRVVDARTSTVLDALRARGLTLAVVSNADGRIAGDLERWGLATRFATILDSHVVGLEKPDPAIFRLALAHLGATPDAAVYVGDIFAIDVLGARRAGLRAVLVDPLGCYPGAVDCPRIRHLGELLDLLPAS